ncbi:norsolorinic acid reductase [Aspergillus flavus]|uniref:Norsolorinic acid reductase n=1 Tax=Aspergillus flavus TaxID=5059 RepID=A0AB74CFZ8_ASPFL|nr:norsolorinic acid reductase [Aspergillus flavus]
MPLPVHPPPRSPLDRHRQLAPSASVRVTPLCLGAMNFGDAWKDSLGECPKETAFTTLDYSVQGKGAEQSRGQGKTPSDGERSVSKVLETIANSKQTHLTSIALAYVRHKAPYVFPVVGGRKVEHLRGNIAALDLSLSVEEMAQIEAA